MRPPSDAHGRYGDQLEQALRSYESALSRTAPARHAMTDPDADGELHELRMQVIRLAEGLPSACWPRPACEHCRGRREVEALRPRQADDAASPTFTKVRRLCQPCWGAGLALRVPAGD